MGQADPCRCFQASENWLTKLFDSELYRIEVAPLLRPSLAALNCGMAFNSLSANCNRIGKTPDHPRPKFLVLRLELEVMHAPGKLFWGLEFTLDIPARYPKGAWGERAFGVSKE
jgi:hypothetical protein